MLKIKIETIITKENLKINPQENTYAWGQLEFPISAMTWDNDVKQSVPMVTDKPLVVTIKRYNLSNELINDLNYSIENKLAVEVVCETGINYFKIYKKKSLALNLLQINPLV